MSTKSLKIKTVSSPSNNLRRTDGRKKTKELKEDVGKVNSRKEYSCSKYHQPMSSVGHTQFKGKRFYSVNERKTMEEWLAKMRSANVKHK